MRRRIAVLAALVFLAVPLTLTGCTDPARQHCKDATRQAYEDADKVLQQPIDLDRFCAEWNDHPPGLAP